MHAGCSIDNQMINNISYADDMVLLSPSVCALRDLLRVCEDYAEKHGLKYNVKKSMLMVFAAGSISPSYVPPVRLYGAELVRVPKFTYLGHVVTADMKDNCDIDRERRALALAKKLSSHAHLRDIAPWHARPPDGKAHLVTSFRVGLRGRVDAIYLP
nr:uncharacterized protein LOC117996477 [Maniola hyperantus]